MAEEESRGKVAPPAAKVMSHFSESPSTPAPPKSMLGLTCFFDFVSGGPTHTFPTLMLGDRGGKNEALLLMIVVGLENEQNQQKSNLDLARCCLSSNSLRVTDGAPYANGAWVHTVATQ